MNDFMNRLSGIVDASMAGAPAVPGVYGMLPMQYPVSPFANVVPGQSYIPTMQLGAPQFPQHGGLGNGLIGSIASMFLGGSGMLTSGGLGTFSPGQVLAQNTYANAQADMFRMIDRGGFGDRRFAAAATGLGESVLGSEAFRRRDLEALGDMDVGVKGKALQWYDKEMARASEKQEQAIKAANDTYKEKSDAIAAEIKQLRADIKSQRTEGISAAKSAELDRLEAEQKNLLKLSNLEQGAVRDRAIEAANLNYKATTETLKAQAEQILDTYIDPTERAEARFGKEAGRIANQIRTLAAGGASMGMLDAFANMPGAKELIDLAAGDIMLGRRVFDAMTSIPGMDTAMFTADPRQAATLTNALLNRMYKDGGEDFSFTQGRTAAEVGDVAKALGQRGLLAVERGAGGDYKASISKIAEQIGGLLEITGELENIFGRGKTMDQLIASLETMTGGGLSQMTSADLQNLVRNTAIAADVANVSPERAAQIAAAAAEDARRRGLEGPIGAEVGLMALQAASVAGRAAGGQTFFGRSSIEERAGRMASNILGGYNSDMARRLGGMLEIFDTALGGVGGGNMGPIAGAGSIADISAAKGGDSKAASRLQGLVDRMRKGELSDEDRRLVSDAGAGALSSLIQKALPGTDAGVIGFMLENASPEARERFMKENGTALLRMEQRSEDIQTVARYMGAMEQFQGVDSAAVIKGLLKSGDTSESGKYNAAREALRQQGFRGAALDSMTSNFLNMLDPLMYQMGQSGMIGSPDVNNFIVDNSDGAIEAERRSQRRAAAFLSLDERMRGMGLGRGSIVDRAFDMMIKKGKTSGETETRSLRDVLTELSGGMEIEKVLTPAELKKVDEFEEKYGKKIAELKAKERDTSLSQEERDAANAELAKIYEGMPEGDELLQGVSNVFKNLDQAAATREKLEGAATEDTQISMLQVMEDLKALFSDGKEGEEGKSMADQIAEAFERALKNARIQFVNAANQDEGTGAVEG